jgi:hypothetical protein
LHCFLACIPFVFKFQIQAGPACRGHPLPQARLGLEPKSGHSTARPLPARCPGSTHQGSHGRPIKSSPLALGPANLAAVASTCEPKPLRCLHRRTSAAVVVAASPLLYCREPQPEVRLRVRSVAGRFPPFFPALPRARLLAVIHLPQPLAPRLKPLNAFPSSFSFSQAKPELKSWSESRLCDSPASPPRLPALAPAQPCAAIRSRSDGLD